MALSGKVRSFNPHKGWGFIECDSTSDVFFLKKDLQGFGVSVGDEVSFQVTQNEKGARATDIKVTSPKDGQLFFGEVKSFNQMKGFGFLSSPASDNMFGKDCFVIRSEFGDAWPMEGMHVQYRATVGERGPIASDVRVLDPPKWGKGFGKGFMGFSPWGFGFRDPKETDVFFGTVKAISEKGFGHITSEAMTKIYGKDIFAHKTSIEEAGVQVGDLVSFRVSPGPKGSHAVGIQPFKPVEKEFVGTVTAFNEAKGWGFVESPEAKDLFHSEIFLHRNELASEGGKSIAKGDTLKFAVDVSSGRATAKNVKPA